MYPILFPADSASWESFGIGVLSSAISCEIREERNGPYELEMQYPISGVFFDQIALRNVIVAKPNYIDPPQPFRIYNISKPISGMVTVSAQHISYDLSGYVDAPFTIAGIQAAIRQMTDDSTVYPNSCPFTISSDMSSSVTMKVKHPQSVRALMGGVSGSLIDTYGGEWHFDGYNCSLNAARGEDRGVVIRYGKNLLDLTQEENNAAVYTGVYPYYFSTETEVLVTLPEKVVDADGTYDFAKILPLDLTSEFQNPPSQADLRERAEAYIEQHDIGVPKVNLTIKFLEMDSFSERVDLCDTVAVRFEKLGVTASAKCIRTLWDVLRERYIEAELGSAKKTLAATIADSREMEEAFQDFSSQLKTVTRDIADKVTGNLGGYIILHDTDQDGEPDEILIMDAPDINTALRIIRFNNAGIAFSKTGYNGTYSTAWNIDGEFVANFIASGELQTDRVQILGDTQFYWDDANITLINPNDTNQIIKFGKYDGVHYGLGFSRDGGTTWKDGFSFEGITVLGGVESAGYMSMDGKRMKINNDSDVTIAYIGEYQSTIAPDGTRIAAPFYLLGTVRDFGYIGAYAFSAGRYSRPSGPYSVTAGYSNSSLSKSCISIGDTNTSYSESDITIGTRCEASGKYSIAYGYECQATAENAVAIGDQAKATAIDAVAMGHGAKAEGSYSVALGNWAKSSGISSVALGRSEAQGDYSNSLGYMSTASGDFSCAIGYASTSVGDSSFAAGKQNLASGANSFSIGHSTVASGTSSFAGGYETEATGKQSVAIGYKNKASGRASVSFGGENVSSGDCATTFGLMNNAGNYQFVCGIYANNNDSNYLFVVGNSTVQDGQPVARSNALYLRGNGTLWIAGDLIERSDGRLKTVIGEPPDLSSIRAVRYKWNNKESNTADDLDHIGYIAQDVEKIAPYLIHEDANGYKALDYIALLCAKVEQLEKTVASLTLRIAELEGEA